MSSWILAGIFAVLAALVALAFFFYAPRRKWSEEAAKGDSYAELKASVLFLHSAIPALLFILAALGFGSYEVIVNRVINRVTDRVTTKVDSLLQKVKIDSLVDEIENFHQRASDDARSIRSMEQVARDTIRVITNQVFLRLLPRGTIIPYSGKLNDIDSRYWAICDGTKGTPNLTDRFIMGSTFKDRGDKGGSRTHTHLATLRLNAEVAKTNEVKVPLKEGEGLRFDVERHDHEFKIVKQSIIVAEKETLPPYYRLVFLMKIK